MKLKFATALSGVTLLLSTAVAQAVTISGNDKMCTLHSGAVKIGCVGGKRCTGYYTDSHGARVCRGWVACK